MPSGAHAAPPCYVRDRIGRGWARQVLAPAEADAVDVEAEAGSPTTAAAPPSSPAAPSAPPSPMSAMSAPASAAAAMRLGRRCTEGQGGTGTCDRAEQVHADQSDGCEQAGRAVCVGSINCACCHASSPSTAEASKQPSPSLNRRSAAWFRLRSMRRRSVAGERKFWLAHSRLDQRPVFLRMLRLPSIAAAKLGMLAMTRSAGRMRAAARG